MAEAAEDLCMAEEFPEDNPIPQEVLTFQAALARLIDLDTEKKRLKDRMDDIAAELANLKEFCMDQFAELGVTSMKAHGRTVYLSSMIWAGVGEGSTALQVADELKRLNLANFISINTQSLSGYTRELARDTQGMADARGNIIAEPDEILAVMPGNLPQLLKVTSKSDIKIRK